MTCKDETISENVSKKSDCSNKESVIKEYEDDINDRIETKDEVNEIKSTETVFWLDR